MSKLRVVLVLSIITAFYIEKLSAAKWTEARAKFIELIQKWDELHNAGFMEAYNRWSEFNPGVKEEVHFLRAVSAASTEKKTWAENLKPIENSNIWGPARYIFVALIQIWDTMYKKLELHKSYTEVYPKGFQDEATFVIYACGVMAGVCEKVKKEYRELC